MLATKPAPSRAKSRAKFDNLQELVDSLGGIPAARILFDPPPGTATVRDVIRYVDGDERRLVELVNGTLVEKTMGASQSFLAIELSIFLGIFQRANFDAGMLLGADGTCTIGRGPAQRIEGKNPWTFSGKQYNMYQREHDLLFAKLGAKRPDALATERHRLGGRLGQ